MHVIDFITVQVIDFIGLVYKLHHDIDFFFYIREVINSFPVHRTG